MARYLLRIRDDGLPTDPWLRVHVRAGGRIVGVAPRSMTVVEPLSSWRAWTGLPFDRPGPVPVPHALVPVYCHPDRDLACYVEPNVWVHHDLSTMDGTSRPLRPADHSARDHRDGPPGTADRPVTRYRPDGADTVDRRCARVSGALLDSHR